MGCTGNSAMLTDGSWTAAVNITTIGGLTKSVPALDQSTLATEDYAVMCRGDLITLGPIDCAILWDQDNEPPIEQGEVPWTLTFPTPTGKSQGATLVGTAFITESTGPDLTNNELQEGSFQLQFKGDDLVTTPSAP